MSLLFSGGPVHPENDHEEEPYSLHCGQCGVAGGEASSQDSAMLAALFAGFHIRPLLRSEFISMKTLTDCALEAYCSKCVKEFKEVETT